MSVEQEKTQHKTNEETRKLINFEGQESIRYSNGYNIEQRVCNYERVWESENAIQNSYDTKI